MDGIIATYLAAISGVVSSSAEKRGGHRGFINLIMQTVFPVIFMTKDFTFRCGHKSVTSFCQPSKCFSRLDVSLLSNFSC